MKGIKLLKAPGYFLYGMLSLLLNPLFVVPFIAGAAYSYFYSDDLSGARLVSAETRPSWDDKDTNPVRKALADKARLANEEQKSKKKELTKSGVLSQTHSSGTSATTVGVPWGTDVLEDKPAPISGSVSRVGVRDWVLRMFNNTEDTYSASVEVVQLARDGKRLKSDHYSYTLKPKAKTEKKFSTMQNVTDCSLNLTKWKNLTGDKKKATEAKSSQTPAAQVVQTPATPVEANSANAEPAQN